MIGPIAILLVGLGGAPQAAPLPPIDPVYLRTPQGVEGNGARFLVGERCLTLTAWHVVEGSNVPQIVPMRSQADQGIVEKRDEKLDVGVVVQNGGAQRSCARLPTSEQIDQALFGRTREVWYVNGSGEALPFRVGLVRYNGTSIRLEILPDSRDPLAPKAFNPGMSGALVVFDGVPVAILQSSETAQPVAEAVRIDFIVKQFPTAFVAQSPVTPVATRRVYAPYDIAQLPAEYRDLVKAARDVKKRAINAASAADRVRRQAEDAAALAKRAEKGVVYQGRAHFDADDTNNYYAGEVFEVGALRGSAGYGVSEVMKGDGLGTRSYCRYVRDAGCAGLGVIEYADNKANEGDKLLRWRGELSGPRRTGLGVLEWRDGVGQAWLNMEEGVVHPGIWREPDNRLFEGEVGNSWSGRGVLWDAEGRIVQIGTWKNGKVVTIDNAQLQNSK